LLLEHGARPDLGSYHMGEADFDQRCLKIEARLAARELETAANDGGGDDDAAFGDLAPWVAVQRMQHKHGRMTAPRAARLKALGVLRPSDGGGEGVLRAKEVADEVGATPLIVAARWGKPAIVKWLLGFGADPAQLASTGRWRGLTARQVAEQAASQRSQPKDLRRAQVECVQLLAEKEAPLARETRLAAEAKLRSAMLPPEGEAITSARLAKAVAAAEKAHVAPDLVAHAAEVRAKVAAEEAARRTLRSALAAAGRTLDATALEAAVGAARRAGLGLDEVKAEVAASKMGERLAAARADAAAAAAADRAAAEQVRQKEAAAVAKRERARAAEKAADEAREAAWAAEVMATRRAERAAKEAAWAKAKEKMEAEARARREKVEQERREKGAVFRV